MFSLPDLAPTDSYTLWYTPSTATTISPTDPQTAHDALIHGQSSTLLQQNRRNALHRTPLARLRLDEEYLERRKENIRNYGHLWIKPPGIPKSLSQQRDERREMLEHQEAMRREQLAQELLEAEQQEGEMGGMEEGMEEGEGEEVMRDLDDDVPDAETTGLDADDESEEESEEDDEDDDDEDEENGVQDVPRGLGVRPTGDAFREAMARGSQPRNGMFGDDGASDLDEEDNSQMLQEQDLVHESGGRGQHIGMDMDADLDADIPEAEEEYEHTDTEEEISSSEEMSEEGHDLPRRFTASTSMVRSDGTQNSMDLSGLISNSSQLGSSPRRRSGQLPQNRRF